MVSVAQYDFVRSEIGTRRAYDVVVVEKVLGDARYVLPRYL